MPASYRLSRIPHAEWLAKAEAALSETEWRSSAKTGVSHPDLEYMAHYGLAEARLTTGKNGIRVFVYRLTPDRATQFKD